MRPFDFTKVTTVKDGITKKNDVSQFIAGGTNLLDLMKKNIAQPETLLDITGLSTTIKTQKTGIQIGAMVRNSALTLDKEILANYPLVAKAVLAGASPQIRNMASTGGNLLQRTRCVYFYDTELPCNKRNPGSGCSALNGSNRMSAIVGWSEDCVAVHPSDLCVALTALDATVRVTDKNQTETVIPFKDFHRLPGTTPDKDNNLPSNAIITAIEIPVNPFNRHYAYLKLRDRDSYAFALVSVAAALNIENNRIVDARLASGGVAHKPWRWLDAENFLKGKEATTANFQEAARIAAEQTKPLEHNAFKVPMLKGAIEVALQNCLTA
jgi:xanthine dehydrogenase YagS FAD-binding subunit